MRRGYQLVRHCHFLISIQYHSRWSKLWETARNLRKFSTPLVLLHSASRDCRALSTHPGPQSEGIRDAQAKPLYFVMKSRVWVTRTYLTLPAALLQSLIYFVDPGHSHLRLSFVEHGCRHIEGTDSTNVLHDASANLCSVASGKPGISSSDSVDPISIDINRWWSLTITDDNRW